MSKNIETMIAEVDKLDDQIFELNQTIADKVNAIQTKKAQLKSMLDVEIAKAATEELKGKDYGCGTATIETARHKIKVVVSKKITWDEGQLHGIRDLIIAAGENPLSFIKEKLSVSETTYKYFPEDIQKIFEPAREVTPSAPKITIERK